MLKKTEGVIKNEIHIIMLVQYKQTLFIIYNMKMLLIWRQKISLQLTMTHPISFNGGLIIGLFICFKADKKKVIRD